MDPSFFHAIKGTIDDSNPISKIRGNGLILTHIHDDIKHFYESHVVPDEHAYSPIEYFDRFRLRRSKYVTFPPPTGININMMPFKIHDLSTLPWFCGSYHSIIKACLSQTMLWGDTIAYLTIQESHVPCGSSQRRPGLHIDSPIVKCESRLVKRDPMNPEYRSLAWGLGSWIHDYPVGGIFIASSVKDTTRVYPYIIEKPEEIADKYGGLECIRPYIGEGYTLDASELCWITDRTPHESLPVPEDTQRQFFRLVVGKIDVWYEQHNTPNPKGILPDAEIVSYNKFTSE